MKNFTQKFIGIFALVFAMSFTANAQNPCQSTADSYMVIINQLEATTNEYWQDLQMCESASYANQIYLDNCNSDKAEIQSELNAANQQIISLQSQLNNAFTQADLDAAYAAGAASITPEDGISQAEVDAAVADATPLDVNIPIELPQGWSMFGYTCVEPTDVVDAIAEVVNSVEILKDEMGLSYLPGWNFNAIGDFKFAEGYQIKLYESIADFSFCSTLRYKTLGCTDQAAFNYNIIANTDDGNCFPVIEGCMDETAFNYIEPVGNENIDVNTDDDSCVAFEDAGCMDETAFNYDETALIDDGSCEPIVLGCIDELYAEYNPQANTDNGSCVIIAIYGCTDPGDPNYASLANVNDGSCEFNIGCTNPEASNYDPIANECANNWDCECSYETYGCTDSSAINYSPGATINMGCVYQLQAGPSCSTLEILSTVTNVFDNLPSGISVQDEVSFSIDLKSSEWSIDADENPEDYFYDEITIGSNFTYWQAAQPVQYEISYSGGYSESGQITSIRVSDGGVSLYASPYFYNQGEDWIMDWSDGQDKIEFYDGNTKIYDMQMGGNANLSYASNIGDVALALTNTYVSGTFYWANYQVGNFWTTYHQDHSTEQGATSFSVTELDCNSVYVDECGVPNGDNSSCLDECGVPNGDNSSCADETIIDPLHLSLIQECLNGDGFACLQANDYVSAEESYELPELYSCFEYGDPYMCEVAATEFPEEMGNYLGLNNVDEYLDECGVFNGDNSSCADQCGVPNGDNSSCLDECGVPNGGNLSCTDCAGVVNGTLLAPAGYDCDGNALQIGDVSRGGIVFQINEDGTGLVADLEDLGRMGWRDAMLSCSGCTPIAGVAGEATTSQGYDDWYLPTPMEAQLMYNTIGNGGPEGNIGNFEDEAYYWTSGYGGSNAIIVNFNNGEQSYNNQYASSWVRLIRVFGLNDPVPVLDECGVINGDNSSCIIDECGVPNGDNSSCTDECGIINGDNSSCADECGVPNGDNSSCTDACGIINGDNSSCADECGVPNGDNSSCTDECGVPNGDNSSCLDECGVPNGDNSSCLDCAGLVNGTSEDLGCGCGNPAAEQGYDCDGNINVQVGDEAFGGIVFQINENGTGLVSDLQNLGSGDGRMTWYDAMNVAESATSQGYDDWLLPSLQELQLMYSTIGQGGSLGNIGGFNNAYYWSADDNGWNIAQGVDFYNGYTSNYASMNELRRVRVIRAF